MTTTENLPDFQEEYQDYFQGLGEPGMVFLVFLNTWFIRIPGVEEENQEATIRFGKRIEDSEVSKDVAIQLRRWLKEQKSWIRKEQKSASFGEIKRRMWWLGAKMIEHGIFQDREQKTVLVWLDMCMDRCSTR
jgi:AAA+ ATPase superfamily predicted ATPase